MSSLLKSTLLTTSEVIPPKMFECVSEGVYRSNLVTEENIIFLQSIHLHTVIVLGDCALDQSVLSYFDSYGITIVYLADKCPLTQNDWKPIQDDTVKTALEYIMDASKKPILIMCSDGISKTGIVVGCYRRMQNWCVTSIIQEFRRIARETKEDPNAELYIELFSPELISFNVFHNKQLKIQTLHIHNHMEDNKTIIIKQH